MFCEGNIPQINLPGYRRLTRRVENLYVANGNSNLLSDKPGTFGTLTDSASIQIVQSQCLHIFSRNGGESRLSINSERGS